MSKPPRRRRNPQAADQPGGLALSILATARVTGRAGLPVVLTYRAFAQLARELGGGSAAWAFIGRVAAESGKPVFANGPRQDGAEGSQTVAIAPPSWTQERLTGFCAGLKDELAEAFGAIDGQPSWPGRAA